MWVFSVLEFALEEKLCGKKCCKYFGPEGAGVTTWVIKYSTIALYIQYYEQV